MNKEIILIGYSGHAYVVCDAFISAGIKPAAYCEPIEKSVNPYGLKWLGSEDENPALKNSDFFVAIGNNNLRKKIQSELTSVLLRQPVNAIHKSAVLSEKITIGNGVLVSAGAILNSMSSIGNGVILNTGSIIEHECQVGDYVHIAPGAILCGNVSIGENSFVGAGAVIREGIRVGKNVIIGAGTVVNRDVPDEVKIVGNPYRII